jgi:hypothetical protein
MVRIHHLPPFLSQRWKPHFNQYLRVITHFLSRSLGNIQPDFGHFPGNSRYFSMAGLVEPVELTMNYQAAQEIKVFTEARKTPLQKRGVFLDISCAGDENLRGKVEALLEAHDRMGNILGKPSLTKAIEPKENALARTPSQRFRDKNTLNYSILI